MVYNNLEVVSLSAKYINPSMRDAIVYSNCPWPWAMEALPDKLREVEAKLKEDEDRIAETYPKVSQVLDLPVYSCDARAIEVVDKLFSTVDSDYKEFGSSLPKVRLVVYSGAVCKRLTTAEWEDQYKTLLNKFPDLRSVWNNEIHAVSLRVLRILDCIGVYYRRAMFFDENRKVEEEQPFDSIIAMKGLSMRYKAIEACYKSHLSETAPFLDSLDRVTGARGMRTSLFSGY